MHSPDLGYVPREVRPDGSAIRYWADFLSTFSLRFDRWGFMVIFWNFAVRICAIPQRVATLADPIVPGDIFRVFHSYVVGS